ncbi:MAG: hypothetical protein FK732_07225 [Asgard group archaeon]|nr:hypothetical protein [Asgard group archaeon]
MKDKKIMDKTNEKKTDEPIKSIPTEDIEKHPELSRTIEEPVEPRRRRGYHYIPKQFIERMNKPLFTNLILGFSVILSLAYFTFGTLGAISSFGNTENVTWRIYEATAILGWEQMRITGFVLIVIGLIMIWSVPYYLTDKTQKADSYLVIGLGIGMIFGFIYILIILADVLTAAITTISESTPFQVETFFYIPIILALFALPLFRILAIRHMVVLPFMDEEDRPQIESEKGEAIEEQLGEEKKWRFEHHHYRKHRKFRYQRKEWRREWKKHGRHKKGRKK